MVEVDQEGEVVEAAAVHMIHLLVVEAVEVGQLVQMMSALEVVEDTSCLEEEGALLNLV